MALKKTHTYDAALVNVSIGGTSISGFKRDSFVKVEHSEAAWTKQVSADGIPSRSKSNNYTGKITIVLQQTSESNKYLQSIHASDQFGNDGIVDINIADLSGQSNYVTAEGWVEKSADIDFGAEEKDRTWVFDCAEITMNTQGNTPA